MKLTLAGHLCLSCEICPTPDVCHEMIIESGRGMVHNLVKVQKYGDAVENTNEGRNDICGGTLRCKATGDRS